MKRRGLIGLTALSLLIAGCSPSDQGSDPADLAKMYYVVESDKSFDQATSDLDTAVKAQGFGVLKVHDLGSTLRSKGIAFEEQCKIFEVCNPIQAGPPCSEGVKWYIRKTPTQLSKAQIEAFAAVYDHNNRSVQALNDRTLYLDESSAVTIH